MVLDGDGFPEAHEISTTTVKTASVDDIDELEALSRAHGGRPPA
jgi:hypothetical protein